MAIELKAYQEFVSSVALYPKQQSDQCTISAMYAALGLNGEAGEVAEHIKKWHRGGDLDREKVVKELGDVLWYVTEMCNILDISLEGVFLENQQKLQSRKDRGVLHGHG